MQQVARRGIHYWQRLNAAHVHSDLIQKGQNRVIDASLTFIRERAKLKVVLLSTFNDFYNVLYPHSFCLVDQLLILLINGYRLVNVVCQLLCF